MPDELVAMYELHLCLSKQEMCLHFDLLFFLWGMSPILLKSKI